MGGKLIAAVLGVGLIAGVAATGASPQWQNETLVRVCGDDESLASEIPLGWPAVVLAADGRFFSPCPVRTGGPHPDDHREVRERDVIARAAASTDARLRRLAVQGYGRNRASIRVVTRSLTHRDAGVRKEAVVALGALLRPVVREPATLEALLAARDAGADPLQIAEARAALQLRLARESNEAVAGAILETLGGLPYADNTTRDEVETFLTQQLPRVGSPARLLGATKGLEALIRRGRQRPVSTETVERLREVVRHSTSNQPFDADANPGETVGDLDVYARARRAAMLALSAARDTDVPTVLAASRDVDWQVRRIATARMNADMSEFESAIENALRDRAFQVRLEALGVVGRVISRTGLCAPLVTALNDDVPAVAMAALDQLPINCEGRDAWLPGLVDTASELEAGRREGWHVPVRALAALARIAPERAQPLLDVAANHSVWRVRAAAAEVGLTLRDEAVVIELARDREANVRTAALGALRALENPALFELALEALTAADYDLVRTAAGMLQGTPDREEAVTALLFKLGRLTDELSDTSRDPRVAIIERLGELMEPSQASSLIGYFGDFDSKVGLAAVDAFRKLTGIPPAGGTERHRYPYQPTVGALSALPRFASLHMADGSFIEMELLLDDAPVAIARFAELAQAGYYSGLTFHRFAPNFVVQGGSPGANVYSGTSRYLRDEIGAPNLRGTVGLSTRGRDTGDGQIFINLVDNLRLDGDYTVFARVISGMDVVDAILPGATIETITVR